MMATYSAILLPKVLDTAIEPYNAVMSFHQLVGNVDECVLIDQEALSDV